MSKWPSPQDYREAIQHPKTCFHDEDLRAASIELDNFQLPKVQCGNFAAVFRLNGEEDSWAVRCFVQDFERRDERYRSIAQFLHDCDMKEFVRFELLDKGIKIGDNWYPILKMQFIEGETFGNYIQRNLSDRLALQSLLRMFEQMVLSLKERQIAHGDLQHDNIIVSNGNLRLVDYDGLFIPSLSHLKSNELGHPNYQHPKRENHHFGPYLDNFSAWLIKASLQCLIEKPSLYEKLNRNEESILLQRGDLLRPEASEAFWLLEQQGRKIEWLSQLIRSLINLPVENIQSLDCEIVIQRDLQAVAPWSAKSKAAPIIKKNAELPKSFPVLERMDEDTTQNSLPFFAQDDISENSVLKSFPASLILRSSSRSKFHYWKEVNRRARLSFSKSEEELWSGSHNTAYAVSQDRQTNGRSGTFEFNWNELTVFLLVLATFPIAALLWVPFWIFPRSRKSVSEPKHLAYILTNKCLKIIVETDEEFSKGDPPSVSWNVLLIDIPLTEILSVTFPPFKPERVILHVLSENSFFGNRPTKNIVLFGFSQVDRAIIMMRLKQMGIACKE